MAKYEILYIIRPNIEEEAKNALVARFDSILTDNGATVVESKDWEKRRLAYEIQDFREGLYHVVNVEANDDAALNEFDRLSKINGDILRHMIVKLNCGSVKPGLCCFIIVALTASTMAFALCTCFPATPFT